MNLNFGMNIATLTRNSELRPFLIWAGHAITLIAFKNCRFMPHFAWQLTVWDRSLTVASNVGSVKPGALEALEW